MTDPTPPRPACAEEALDGVQDEMGMAQSLRLAPDQPQWIRWRTEIAAVRAELSRRQQEIDRLTQWKMAAENTITEAAVESTRLQQEIERLRQAQTPQDVDGYEYERCWMCSGTGRKVSRVPAPPKEDQ